MMANLKDITILLFIICNLILLSQSSEIKKARDESNKKWNIVPYVGLKGILKFYRKNIKFMVEKISEKNVKYKYHVSYPNREYANNWIGLDLKKKQYTSPSIFDKGIIIDIQHHALNISRGSEEDEQNDKDNEEESKVSVNNTENDMKNYLKTNKNLQTLANINLKKWKIIPYIKMLGVYKDREEEILFIIENIDTKAKYKYFVSYPDHDISKEWVKINFKKKKYSTKDGGKYAIVKIYDPKVKEKEKKAIENLNENVRLHPSAGGVLVPSLKTLKSLLMNKGSKIQFSIIRIEKNPEFLKNEPNKIFWVNYPHCNVMDEYISIYPQNLTYSDSNYFGHGIIELRTETNENFE